MGSSSFAFSAAVLVFLVLVSSQASPSLSSDVNDDVLDTICAHVSFNVSDCVDILKTDPRTSSVDIPTLSLISINLTMKQAVINYKALSEYYNNTTDPALKQDFNPCLGFYKDMQTKIKEAYWLAQQIKYQDSNKWLTITNNLATACSVLFIGWKKNDVAFYDTNYSMSILSGASIAVNEYAEDHLHNRV